MATRVASVVALSRRVSSAQIRGTPRNVPTANRQRATGLIRLDEYLFAFRNYGKGRAFARPFVFLNKKSLLLSHLLLHKLQNVICYGLVLT